MTLKAHRGRCAHCGHDHDTARKIAEYRAAATPSKATAPEVPQEPVALHGWTFTDACAAVDSDGDIVGGVWELGSRDGDGNFYAIATVDTGNYDQPEAAEPLARAILARLATPAATEAGEPAARATPAKPEGGAIDGRANRPHRRADREGHARRNPGLHEGMGLEAVRAQPRRDPVHDGRPSSTKLSADGGPDRGRPPRDFQHGQPVLPLREKNNVEGRPLGRAQARHPRG